jgi:hypothetical protein
MALSLGELVFIGFVNLLLCIVSRFLSFLNLNTKTLVEWVADFYFSRTTTNNTSKNIIV